MNKKVCFLVLILTVIFFLVNISEASSTVLFQDGFESGNFSAWNGTSTSEDGNISITSLEAYEGNYLANITTIWGNGSAYVYKYFPASKIVEVEAYFKFEELPTEGKRWTLFRLYSSSYVYRVELVNYTGGEANQYRFRLYYYYNQSGGSYSAWLTLETNVWYAFKTRYQKHETGGQYRLWWNGTEIITIERNTSGTPDPNHINVGLMYPGESKPITLFLDNVRVSTEYVINVIGETNTTEAYAPVEFYSKWESPYYNLSGYIFGTNNSGAWINETWKPFTEIGNIFWANMTKEHLNETFGYPVFYQFWANDTNDNWGTTGLQRFLTKERDDSLFEAHFESGLESDYVPLRANNGWQNIIDTCSHIGNYAVNCTTFGGAFNRSRVGPIGSFDVRLVFSRAYFYFVQRNGYIEALELSGHYDNGTYWLGPFVEVRPGQISLTHVRNNTMGHYPGKTYYTTINLNQWYCIELMANLSESGGYRVFLNGEKIIEIWGENLTGADSYDTFWSGIILANNVPSYFQLYMDDFVLDDEYIGPQPCDNGAVMYNNTLQKNMGDKYLDNAINASCTELSWGNNALRTVFRNTTDAQTGKAIYYWKDVNSSLKIRFNNGTVLNAEDYWNETTKLLTIPFNF